MVAMAERPKKAKPAKKPNRTGVALGCYIDEELRTQMDAFIASHNQSDDHPASVRSTVEAALRAYLKGKGFWPPKGQD